MQLKNDANMETLQPTRQNDIVAIKNNYTVSKNENTTNENKNKQIHSQIKIHNTLEENCWNWQIQKAEHKTECNYTFVKQAINKRKSSKKVTKEIKHIKAT